MVSLLICVVMVFSLVPARVLAEENEEPAEETESVAEVSDSMKTEPTEETAPSTPEKTSEPTVPVESTEPDIPKVESIIPGESEPTIPEEPVPEETTTPAPKAPIPATVKVKLNVREEPSTYSSIVEALAAGTQVEIYETTAVNEMQWARIAQGWVLMDYLMLEGSSGEVVSGVCGEALTWEFDGSTGRLTISGTGDMWNFEVENTPWDSYTGKIVSIVVKEGVQSIGEDAFWGCGALTSVSLPEGLRALGAASFLGCYSLRKIQLPETLTILGEQAFFQCERLESVYIPASVTHIGDIPFGICENLTAITVDPANQYYCNDENGYLYSKDKTVLHQVLTNISGSYTVPDCVTKINRLAFAYCRFLTELTIPDSVIEIGDAAFGDCRALKRVRLPSKLTRIEWGLFIRCLALESITIPASVKSFNNQVFADMDECNGVLAEIIFEGPAPELAELAFENITATAYYPANNPTWTADVMQNYGGTITWIAYDAPETDEPAELTIPEETAPEKPAEPEDIASGECGYDLNWAFDKGSGTLTISGKGNSMFDYTVDKPAPWSGFAAAIKDVTFSSNINTIGDYDFENCTGLTSVVLPGEDYLSLGTGAFSGCVNLTEIRFAGQLCYPVPEDVFVGVTANAYYPAGCGWSGSDFRNYGGSLTWIEYGEDAVMLTFHSSVIRVGETRTTTVEAHPAKATADCTFTVDDPSIVEIVSSNRKSVTFKGLKKGRTILVVTDQNTGLTVSKEVCVYDSREISLPYTEQILVDAEPFIRSYTVTPTETAKYVLMMTDVNAPGWDSSGVSVLHNGAYVSVSDWYWGEGIIRQIVELTAGKTYEILAESLHPELGATATVEFRKAGTEVSSIDIQQDVIGVSASGDALGWASVIAYPLDAYLDRSDIQWSIRDSDIAEIERSSAIECGFRGKKPGTTELTVTCNGFTDTAIIHVYDAQTVYLDETVEIQRIPGSVYSSNTVLFTPEEDGRYVFTVTNNGIRNPSISYDCANGDVYYGHGDGSQTLSVELTAGKTFTLRVNDNPFVGTCTITVNKATDTVAGMEIVCTYDTPDRVEFGARFTPSTAAENVVKWEVSNPSLLGHSRGDGDPYNNQAYYTPYGTGQVTVTATSESGLTASCTMVVGRCMSGHRYSDFSPVLDSLGNPTKSEYRTCYRCDIIEERNIRPAATSGTCGDNLTWEFDADTGTLSISGTGAMYDFGWDTMPWKAFKKQIQTVQLPEGLTTLGICAFTTCHNLTSINLPDSLTTISDSALEECHSLTSLTIPGSVKHIGTYAFSGAGLTELTLSEGLETIDMYAFMSCFNLKRVELPDSLKTLGGGAFQYCRELETAQLPETLNTVSWHTFNECSSLQEITIPKTVTEISYFAFNSCTALNAVEFEGPAPSAGEPCPFNSVTADAWYPADDISWTDEAMQRIGGDLRWVPKGTPKNCIIVDSTELDGAKTVWIDGVEHPVYHRGGSGYVYLTDSKAKTMVVHTYHVGDSSDIHTQYPVSMKVWTLANEDGIYTATRQNMLDDILQYSGMSIRVFGKKGVRMITSISQEKKNALVSGGLAGYTLKEYGTAIAWTDQLSGDKPLVLGKYYVKSNYAYRKGVADPVFNNTGDLMQYTNVLVNFTNEQCKNDIAMRPYMILVDENGQQITLYGGIVQRSIGYIACQNRNVFEPGTDEYEYVWEIIHYVYGDLYDDDYKIVWSPPSM